MGRRAFSRELAEKNGLAVDRYPANDDEARVAAEVLATDLERLSVEEQEKLVFDIHGLPCTNPATEGDCSTYLEGKLRELERELLQIPNDKKTAYEHALYLNPEYVQGRTFRKLFLESANYDVSLAADQIAQHFETKKRLFGGGCSLGRDLLLSDLSEEDMEFLEKSLCQVLPTRDAAGRVVLFCAPGTGKMDYSDSMFRAYWYFVHALVREEGVMEDGVVIVDYFFGNHSHQITIQDHEKIYNNFVDGGFLKVVVEHFCYDDPTLDKYCAGAAVFTDESYRHRLRCHSGTVPEVLFKLQTFGIPTQDFPINDEQELEFSWHQQWIQAHRKKEADMSSTLCIVPRRFDVLFGRGRDTRVHTGNLRAKHLVEERFEEYEKASKHGKTVIAEQVVAAIKKSYGRFLKWENEDAGWVEVDFDTARAKIAHFFRRRRADGADTADKSTKATNDAVC